MHFGFRDYDPDIGRWTAKDPLLFAGSETDLYGYCLNDPVNLTDPMGLWSIDIGFTGGSGRASVNFGLQVGSSGVFLYYGVGLGGGAGFSATISSGNPSIGVSVSGTIRGGTGTWGGYGSWSMSSVNPLVNLANASGVVGFGWGIGWGFSLAVTHTFGYSLTKGWRSINQDLTLSNPCPSIL